MLFRITYEDTYKDTKTLVIDVSNVYEAEKFSKNLGKVLNIECIDKIPKQPSLFSHPYYPKSDDFESDDYDYSGDMG